MNLIKILVQRLGDLYHYQKLDVCKNMNGGYILV